MNEDKGLQPCGHPVQAMRSIWPDGGGVTTSCGWCEDIEKAYYRGRDLANEIYEILHRSPEEIREREQAEAAE